MHLRLHHARVILLVTIAAVVGDGRIFALVALLIRMPVEARGRLSEQSATVHGTARQGKKASQCR